MPDMETPGRLKAMLQPRLRLPAAGESDMRMSVADNQAPELSRARAEVQRLKQTVLSLTRNQTRCGAR